MRKLPYPETPEQIEQECDKLIEKFDVPTHLQEDFRQEVALAHLESLAMYDVNVARQKLSARQYVQRAAIKFLKRETDYGMKVECTDAIELSHLSDSRESIRTTIDSINESLDELLEKMVDGLGWNGERSSHVKRCQVLLEVILESHDCDIDSGGITTRFSKRIGVGKERGRQIKAKMIRQMRHPRRTKHIRRYLEIFDEIRDLQDTLN